jgi:hypothetical protein
VKVFEEAVAAAPPLIVIGSLHSLDVIAGEFSTDCLRDPENTRILAACRPSSIVVRRSLKWTPVLGPAA